jgi:biopolymer transport protein ExbD
MATASRLALPQRKPTYRFALTPLADAMFQLLIFFMLSSSLTPYSLLTLKSAPPPAEEASATGAAIAEAAPASPAEAAPRDTALWTVEAETLIVGGQSFGFEALPDLAAALGSASAPADVILILRPSARVQDVTTILEALQLAQVASVQVTTAGGS